MWRTHAATHAATKTATHSATQTATHAATHADYRAHLGVLQCVLQCVFTQHIKPTFENVYLQNSRQATQQRPIHMQKRPIYIQKRPIYIQKRPTDIQQKKRKSTHTKETYICPKRDTHIYVHKKTHIHAHERHLYTSKRDTYISKSDAYPHTRKRPINIQKRPIHIQQKRISTHTKETCRTRAGRHTCTVHVCARRCRVQHLRPTPVLRCSVCCSVMNVCIWLLGLFARGMLMWRRLFCGNVGFFCGRTALCCRPHLMRIGLFARGMLMRIRRACCSVCCSVCCSMLMWIRLVGLVLQCVCCSMCCSAAMCCIVICLVGHALRSRSCGVRAGIERCFSVLQCVLQRSCRQQRAVTRITICLFWRGLGLFCQLRWHWLA